MRISASEQVQLWLSGLPPDTKRRVRAAFKALPAGDVKALREDLEGFYRLRVGNYRVVYHLEAGSHLLLDYADLREVVYETFKQLRALSEMPGEY